MYKLTAPNAIIQFYVIDQRGETFLCINLGISHPVAKFYHALPKATVPLLKQSYNDLLNTSIYHFGRSTDSFIAIFPDNDHYLYNMINNYYSGAACFITGDGYSICHLSSILDMEYFLIDFMIGIGVTYISIDFFEELLKNGKIKKMEGARLDFNKVTKISLPETFIDRYHQVKKMTGGTA